MTIYIKFAGEPIFGNQAIAAIVGPPGPGTEQTYFDAGLIEQPTLAALNEFLVTESVAAVHPFVDEASTSASTSTNAANEAAEAQAEAEAAALRAEAGAAASIVGGDVALNVTAGLASVSEGQQFKYLSTDQTLVIVARKVSSAAVYITDYPVGSAIQAAVAPVPEAYAAAKRSPGFRAGSVGDRMPAIMEDSGRTHAEIVGGKLDLGPLTREPVVRTPWVGDRLPLAMDDQGRVTQWLRDGAVPVDQQSAVRTPYVADILPLGMDVDGRAQVMMRAGKLSLPPMAEESTVRMPWVGAQLVESMDDLGRVIGMQVDGVRYDLSDLGKPMVATVTAIGQQQAALRSVDPQLLTISDRQISWGQQGTIVPDRIVGPNLMRVTGPDAMYPVGLIGWHPPALAQASNILRIIAVVGQSNGIGAVSNDPGTETPIVVTQQAPMPGKILCFNGGVAPHQNAGSATATAVLDAGRIASVVDAAEGLAAQAVKWETPTMGAAETYLAALGDGSKAMVLNFSVPGASFLTVAGGSVSNAQNWTNMRTAITAAVAYAAANGLTPVIDGLIYNQGEADRDRSMSGETTSWLSFMGYLRAKTNALMALTGQVQAIPIVFCQVTNPHDDDGRATVPTIGTEIFCADPANFATLVPLYWSWLPDVPTVHHRSLYHRLYGEMCGHALFEMQTLKRHRYVRMTAAKRRGRLVTITMSEPVIVDGYGVAPVAHHGVSYQYDGGAVAVESVSVLGPTIRMLLAEDPSGTGELACMGCTGAKNYPDGEDVFWGLGAAYGNRSNIRSPQLYWSHSTGRPLFKWAAQQQITTTIEG